MAEERKCTFCRSKEIRVDSPYVNKHGEQITQWCCLAQRKNHEYLAKGYHPTLGKKPKIEDIEKW